MLAGAWVLLLLPLVDVLSALGWGSNLPVPNIFNYRGAALTLDETLLFYPGVYQPVIFCIGIVLLFSKERGRRRGRLDWTRRWGVLCGCVVLLLSAAWILFISALVLIGIGAEFQSLPLRYQPGVTRLFVDAGATYVRYGLQPRVGADTLRLASSCIAMLLACIALFDALRSSGPKRLALVLLAPLALFSLMYLIQLGGFFLGLASPKVFQYELYFWPDALTGQTANPLFIYSYAPTGWSLGAFIVEATKWLIVLAITVWLTIAQLAAGRQRRKAGGHKVLQKPGKGASTGCL